MSLIKCKECGKEYSDESSACIHCGFPTSLNKDSSDLKTEIAALKVNHHDGRKKISWLLRILTVLLIVRILALSSLGNIADEVMDQYGEVGIKDLSYFLNHPSYDMTMVVFKVAYIASCILFCFIAYLFYKSDLQNKKIYSIMSAIMAADYALTTFGLNNLIGGAAAYTLTHVIIFAAAIIILKNENTKRIRIEMIIALVLCLVAEFASTMDYSISIAPLMGLQDSFYAEITIIVFYIIIVNLFAGAVRQFKLCIIDHVQVKKED